MLWRPRSREGGSRQADPDALLRDLARDPPSAAAVVSVTTDVGELLLHAADEVMTPIISAAKTWEAAEGVWLRSVLAPGQRVVDVGANVGYFTVMAAKAVGPSGTVVAVEPERENLRLLRANVWRNGCDNVRIVAAAASDARGLLALRRSASNAGDHQVHAVAGEDDVLVAAVALDDVLEGERVDVVKIDTQGADHLVVRGLRRTLRAAPGAQMLVEFWLDGMDERGIDAAEVLAGYRALGRPISVLDDDGTATPSADEDILAAAQASPVRFLNLVLGRAAGPAG